MLNSLLSQLNPNCPWKNHIHYYDCVDSTNTLAKKMASEGAPHGTVLIANQQMSGRGRMGRRFQSPDGMGIYLSVILRPNCPPEQLMHLTCAAAVAVCNAVETVAPFRPKIKWTNDLVYHNRKLGGILTELSVEGKIVQYAVIGIGINCHQKVTDFPEDLQDMAGSLYMAAGKSVDRASLAAAMVNTLWEMDSRLLSEQNRIMDAYRNDCITLQQEIVLLRGSQKQYGTALSVDNNGGLVVAFSDGTVQTVTSGEVSVRGMYGYC